jgi:DNA replication and repair protein RecF
MEASFGPGFHLFLGDNAQGKTNILEAIYLLSTLRSFRGVNGAQMIRHGQKGYFVGARVVAQSDHDIKLYWSPAERQASLDGQPVRKMSDFIGVLRSVVFCSEDLQLIKGPSTRRRRYLDLLLAQTDPAYLPLLQNYSRALRSRNTLLKRQPVDEISLEAFTHELVRSGEKIIQCRIELLPRLSPLARLAFRRVSRGAEELTLEYQPSAPGDFKSALARSRPRERVFRSTVVGPHRDELDLRLDGQPAAKFASEGQKRSLAIALKMAQAEYLTGIHGSPPVLLIDDVMGELDAHRRAAFLPMLDRVDGGRGQVFMTCTEQSWPEELGRKLQKWSVKGGAIRPLGKDGT